jgi:hypothetical protein
VLNNLHQYWKRRWGEEVEEEKSKSRWNKINK